MKKFVFCALGFLFVLLIFAPISFGLAWGFKAIPITIILYAIAWRVFKIMTSIYRKTGNP
mgnify:CR=1 FL=1